MNRGLPVPLSETASVPLLDVGLTGLNVISIEQLAPAARVVPQWLDGWKIDVAVMPVMLRGSGLLLVNVAVRMAEVPTWTSPKRTNCGSRTTSTPTPDNGTVCGLPDAECVTVSAPDLGPTLVGV